MEILKLLPDYKERVWGGRGLNTLYQKPIPSDHTGEAWEVACHENGQSLIANGPHQGKTLKTLLLEEGPSLVGHTFTKEDKFPLLIKLIDAKDDLSVQVHPDDAYAAIHEAGELGKSEAWVVLAAEEGARLVIGLKDGVTKDRFEKALKEGHVESVLNELKVAVGDVINIPAGLVHAIGSGIILAEVQQNSDTTYRVYDWNRLGLDGLPRDLHIDKSLDTIDFAGRHAKVPTQGHTIYQVGHKHTLYVLNTYFSLERIDMDGYLKTRREEAYELYVVLSGQGKVMGQGQVLNLQAGDSIFVPFDVTDYEFYGKLSLLKTYAPKEMNKTRDRLTKKGFDLSLI